MAEAKKENSDLFAVAGGMDNQITIWNLTSGK